MIDGVGSYYWQDKSMRMDGSSIQRAVVREVEQLVSLHDLPVIMTKHVMLPTRKGIQYSDCNCQPRWQHG